jgi:hypothetical protein
MARQTTVTRQRSTPRRRDTTPSRGRIVAWAAGIIVLVLGALVGVRLLAPSASTSDTPVPPEVLSAVTSIPASTFEQIGRGTAQTLPTPISADVRRGANGLPTVTYLGAEYCPYCAAERWAMVIALSRFGQFDGLQLSHSASDDIYPNTPTFSFDGATYTSPYFNFEGVELQSNQRQGNTYAALQTPTPEQAQLLQTYDAPPYVSENAAGAIPFLDIANQYVLSGASYDVGLLRGLTPETIAANLSDPSALTTRAIVGSANMLTAAICNATGNSATDVCGSPAIQTLQAEFGSPRH